MTGRHMHSVAEIKDMLVAQADLVAHEYAPPVATSYTDKGLYYTLNPGRADRTVGSFVIRLSGPRTGTWTDYATGEFGDLLDLIQLSRRCDFADALREARAFLGLHVADPALVRQREAAARDAKARRIEAEKRQRDMAKRASAQAQAIFLSAQEGVRGTPVERYLADTRGIDFARLGRQPRAIRYLPQCYYSHTDPRTGEVVRGEYPAMVALVTGAHGRAVALHRTYLQLRGGAWQKADLPVSKKVLGQYAGAAIHIWSGSGPRGGKGAPLSQAPQGSRVFIAEGIEDALSAAMILPDQRVVAAISLSNLGAVALPPAVTHVTLVADQDENETARKQLARAIGMHQSAGRVVAVWQNRHGGKDLNDALRANSKGSAA